MTSTVIIDNCDAIQSVEVRSFMKYHGLTFEDACELVCLHPEDYIRGYRTDYIPLPADIARDCAAIRSGELVIEGPAKPR